MRRCREHAVHLTGVVACVVVLCAAEAASGTTVTYTTPGLTKVTLPAGVTSVHIVAVGGRGGGVNGGYGAVVSADLALAVPDGSANELRVLVAGNGGIGVAGVNGGGAAPRGLSLAGGGGGWSEVSACVGWTSGICTVFERKVVAAGGGGAGAAGIPGTGGAGGSAGARGEDGSSSASATGAGGGGTGRRSAPASGGSGGVTSDLGCENGGPGDPPTLGGGVGAGGKGGMSASLDGYGDGGGGGGGGSQGSGGGGGGGVWCADDTGMSGGGGGGGNNTVLPPGGQIAVDTSGTPSVTLTYEPAPPPVVTPPVSAAPPVGGLVSPGATSTPAVTILSPTDGAVYAQGSIIRARYTCDATPGVSIASCSAPVSNGNAIDTATLGLHTFAVTATDAAGMIGGATVQYRVADQTRPRLRGLRISPNSIDATDARAFATVRFRLSEAAHVLATVSLAASDARASQARERVISGSAGANSFRLRRRFGRRLLPSGVYRLMLIAVDRAGNRSRSMHARFTIVR
jgi:hypothetical protein